MMNKRALVVGLLVACALHLWVIWPVTRRDDEPMASGEELPPVDSIAVRELSEDKPEEAAASEQAAPQQAPDSKEQAELAKEQPAAVPVPPVPAMEVAQSEPAKPTQPAEVQLAQATPVEPSTLPPAPAPTNVAVQQAPQIESTPAVPDSGPAQMFAPIAAQEAVVESAPVSEAPMPSADAWTPLPAPSAVAALREPEPPPLPPPPQPQVQSAPIQEPQPNPQVAESAPPPVPTRTSPTLRLRSREMRSWNRDDVLSSLPKPDPAFLTATDPRPVRAQPKSSLGAPDAPMSQPAPAPAVELAPRENVPYTPVKFASLRDRTSSRPPAAVQAPAATAPVAPAARPQVAGRTGAEAADRGYLKSLGPVPQDPVARIAWGDANAAMNTLGIGRMALVIVNDDLKVVASIDGSGGTWSRAGLPAQMSTFSNRVRVVDHVSAFAAFARFCQPNEHLAVLVPIGLERRIESAMDQAARAEGLSRRQVAACFGRLEPRQGALEFVIDRVERRQVQ